MTLEQQSAAHYHAAAKRARRLLAEATTPSVKERLGEEAARYEQIARKIERAFEQEPQDEPARETSGQ